MKKIFVLAHDYWHHADSIEPMIKLIFDADCEVTFTTNPADYTSAAPDLFVSFKDPIENDQIPTPIWCDEKWTQKFLTEIENGMGALILHAALTDLPAEHEILTKIIKANFISHPAPCKVSFAPVCAHELFNGVEPFEFPENEEHYIMIFLNGGKTEKDAERSGTKLLAKTESINGTQPALWYHEYGKGKICCITPAHTTENLTHAPFVRLVKNAVKWCMK